jgi:hypothetical protein
MARTTGCRTLGGCAVIASAIRFLRRLLGRVVDLLPDGGAGRDNPAPDIDGRRDTDADYRRAVLRAKSQMSQGGQATTSYEPVERGRLNDQ